MKLVITVTQQQERFRASCPALPGCAIWAASRQEAMLKIEQAIRSYLCSLNAAPPARLETVTFS